MLLTSLFRSFVVGPCPISLPSPCLPRSPPSPSSAHQNGIKKHGGVRRDVRCLRNAAVQRWNARWFHVPHGGATNALHRGQPHGQWGVGEHGVDGGGDCGWEERGKTEGENRCCSRISFLGVLLHLLFWLFSWTLFPEFVFGQPYSHIEIVVSCLIVNFFVLWS